jgi:hypothetical protein
MLRALFRLFSLRFSRADLESLDGRHLAFGLVLTGLAGAGRYWDHPEPEPLQRLGVGSLAYVFALSALLWAVARPLASPALRYPHLLTVVTLTAPLAFLYAVPVERFLTLDAARSANVLFLALVASWRVAIYTLYLRRWAGLRGLSQLVATALPLCLIVAALAALNLEKAVFEIMAGLHHPGTANDDAYVVLLLLTFGSLYAFPVLAVLWIVQLVRKRRAQRAAEVRTAT